MKYVIKYEHLEDELVNSSMSKWCFEKVRNTANENKIELSDDDFINLFKLQLSDKDAEWIIHKMSKYDKTLLESLVLYLTY